MITPNTVNYATQTVNAFTGATNLNFGAPTGTTQVNNDLKVIGNFSVQGTTSTVNSTVTTIQDPVITLGGGVDNANLTSDDNKDRGLELKYYSGGSKLAFMGWDNSASEFAFLYDATNSSEEFSGTDGRLRAGAITISTAAGSNYINYEPNPYSPFNTSDVSSNFQRLIGKYGAPTGTIAMYSGTSAPEGWVLCNGGTATSRSGASVSIPDLRNRFIIGAGSSYGLNSTGGLAATTINQNTGDNNQTPTVSDTIQFSVNNHSLTAGQLPWHNHGISHTHNNVTAALPAHSHSYEDRYLSDSGQGDYDNEESDDQDGQYQHRSPQTDIEPARTLVVSFGDAADISPDRKSGDGRDWGVNNEGHSHGSTKSGTVSISNTTHQHNITFTIPTIPPYYALTFIYKL